ncbi:metal ABC transporter solute-binding protein, Zn/Mn family [Bacillus gobiensis]|uniref:metal ABC transporter solute-binding protein, Zn/Mn family n=1 Tax=Bacillus gobiensis TaxID=1441095 RepID=UPI003D1D3888
MKKLVAASFAFLIVLCFLSACGSSTTSENANDKIRITATIGQITDIANHIGGEHVEVESLMGPGVDPHLYKASQGDIQKLMDADIVFYNGLHLEGKMDEVFEKISKDKPAIPAAESIPDNQLLGNKANPGLHDPHVWFSIPRWMFVVDTVKKELSKFQPDLAEEFKKNAESYKQELKELDEYAREQVETIPKESRVLVTAHDAFQYFGEEYDVEVMGLQGLSTDSEYGLKDVQELVNALTERNIKAVFVESSISEKSINAVVEGAKEKGHEVSIGGELYSDAMGEAGTEEGTYAGMFRHNIDTIVSSLK